MKWTCLILIPVWNRYLKSVLVRSVNLCHPVEGPFWLLCWPESYPPSDFMWNDDFIIVAHTVVLLLHVHLYNPWWCIELAKYPRYTSRRRRRHILWLIIALYLLELFSINTIYECANSIDMSTIHRPLLLSILLQNAIIVRSYRKTKSSRTKRFA